VNSGGVDLVLMVAFARIGHGAGAIIIAGLKTLATGGNFLSEGVCMYRCCATS
jgi:hypothetical protein